MASSRKKRRHWREHKQEEAKEEKYSVDGSRDVGIKDVGAVGQEIIEIDGSMLEGGGQILRNAVTYSCLLRKPVHISKIRARRSTPGLRPQHLTGIQLISELCHGTLVGDYVGSDDISFTPGPIQGGQYMADTKTAGSICLLIQAVLPCLLFVPPDQKAQVVLRGGTNADMAPPIDYLIEVFKPMIARGGVDFECIIDRRGFYPKGGGQATLSPKPLALVSSLNITEKGDVLGIEIYSYTARVVPSRVGHQMGSSAQTLLKKHHSDIPIHCRTEHLTDKESFGNGSGIMITAHTSTGCVFGGSAIGNRKDAPEETGKMAAEELLLGMRGGSCVDEHLQDQLIIFMALADGVSRIRTGPLTLHTRTAIHIAEVMTGVHFEVKAVGNEENTIECKGIGYK